jgi:hypothetical protein
MKTTVILGSNNGRLVLDINLWTIKSHLEDLFQQVLEHLHYTKFILKIAIFLQTGGAIVVTGNNVSSAARQTEYKTRR